MKFVLFIILMLGLSSVHAVDKAEEKELTVEIGRFVSTSLDFTPTPNYKVTTPGKVDITLDITHNKILFSGVQPGKTSVSFWSKDGSKHLIFNLTITRTNNSKVVQELRDFLVDVEGLEIGIKGESVYVGGNIVVPGDIGKVVVILEKYPDVIRLFELSPHTKLHVAKKMQDEIQRVAQNVTVRIVNGQFWLEGVVDSPSKKSRSVEIANAFLPDNIESLARRTDSVQTAPQQIIQDFIVVNEKSSPPSIAKLIQITAQFVELTKDYSRSFGFKWNPVLGGDGGTIQFGKTSDGGVTTRSEGTLAGTISNLFPKLSTAKNAGHARVVQSGQVLVENKKTGSISKTTTTPYSIGTGEFVKESTAKATFAVKVLPEILTGEKMKMGINIKVSSTRGNPPETLDNSIGTNIIVKSKESAVVGGIVVNKSSTDFDKEPADKVENGSPLFTFVRSKTYSNAKSQFVVFVTPEIVESASDGSEKIKSKFRQRGR